MGNRTGRIALTVLGVVALVVGGTWMGQGLNLIPGSFMTGDRTWLVVGLIVAVAGVVLLALALRRPSGRVR